MNSIDLDTAAELGKVVLNLPGFCAKELADLAAAMILGLIRNTVYYDREIRKGTGRNARICCRWMCGS